MIKSRRMRWAGNVARMEKDRSVFKTGTPTRKRLYEVSYIFINLDVTIIHATAVRGL